MISWVEWVYRALLALALTGNIFWIKRWINQIQDWQKKHDIDTAEDLKQMAKEGGLVTRSLFFSFCNSVREKCPVSTLTKWKDSIADEGGVVTVKDFHEDREKQEERVFRGMERLFTEHNKRVDGLLSGIRDTITSNADRLNTVIDMYDGVVGRLDRHIDGGAKNDRLDRHINGK